MPSHERRAQGRILSENPVGWNFSMGSPQRTKTAHQPYCVAGCPGLTLAMVLRVVRQ
jgi:hypothetical protein